MTHSHLAKYGGIFRRIQIPTDGLSDLDPDFPHLKEAAGQMGPSAGNIASVVCWSSFSLKSRGYCSGALVFQCDFKI